jgi:hypothetical protein
MKPAKHGLLATLLIGAIAFLLNSAFIWLQVKTPSDGVRLEPGKPVWKHNGVVVTPFAAHANGLEPGDLVIAVAGRRMEFWVQALFLPSTPRPHWQFGQTVTYTLVRNERQLDVAVALGRYPIGMMVAKNWSSLVFYLIAQLVTAYVLFRRPYDGAAQALFILCWSLASSMTWLLGLQIHDLVGGIGFWLFSATAIGVWYLAWGAGLHFVLVFPQPHPIVLRRPGIVRLVYVAPYLLSLVYVAITRPLASSTLEWLGWSQLDNWQIAFIAVAMMIFIIIQQYRASHGLTRQKIRWLVLATLLTGGGALTLWFLPGILFGHSIITTQALGLLMLPFPLGLAVAILRDRLFDIDIIIRRTLVYGTLTGMLAVVYFGSVVLLQMLLRTFTGQASQLAVVVSTLAIAALFTPLRHYVQAVIDRRFYRRKYDAERVLAKFGTTMRDETNLEHLTAALVAVAKETMQPVQVSLWLREQDRNRGQRLEH